MIRPTRLGIQAIAFWLTLTGGFLATPYQNLYFLLVTFLTVLGLLTPLWALRNLRGVRATLAGIEPIAAGTAATLRVAVVARRPSTQIAVVATVGRESCRSNGLTVHGNMTVGLELPPLPRGVHPLTCCALESSYPFGFVRNRRAITGPTTMVVYPKPLATALEAASAAQASGHGPAAEELTAGIRPWRTGDRMRDVHWRATARSTQLVVREREQRGPGVGAVVLDRRCAGPDLEAALSALSALVLRKREAGEPLAVSSQGWCETFGSGGSNWSDLLHKLAIAESLDASEPAPQSLAGALRLPAVPAPWAAGAAMVEPRWESP